MESLGDPVRLRLLRLLEQEELGVAELCDVMQLPQSTVSRHLKLLGEAAWVTSRKHGAANPYRMTADELAGPARQLWAVARAQTADWPAIEQDRVRLERRLAERSEDSRSFFAAAAREWDRTRVDYFGHRFGTAALAALLPGDWTVADFGCGTGAIVADLATSARSVIGIDNSADMLSAARARLANVPNVELIEADLLHVPLADAMCDAVLCVLSLGYLFEPGDALAEMRRVVKPGGRVVIVDLLTHDRDDLRRQLGQVRRGFRLPEIAALLKAAGLTPGRVVTLPAESHVKGPALFLATGRCS